MSGAAAKAQGADPLRDATGESRAGASEVSADNPFPGLRTFEEADEQFFRGRRAESEDLTRRIKRAALTTCYGVSGLGKSSLLRAGVFPKLRAERYFPVLIRLSLHESAGDFVTQLKAQTVKQAKRERVDVSPFTAEETLWEYFHRAEFWDEWNNLMKPVLVLDQFEELLRKEVAKDDRVRTFLTQLGDLIENRIPASERKRFAEMDELPFQLSSHHYRVVIALREEALPDLEQRMGDIPSIRHNRMRLLPMSGPAALEVVRQNPAIIDEPVAREVVRFIAAGDPDRDFDELEIEPAYLSVFCRELNRERINKGESKITLDRLMVSRDEILSDFYERTLGNKKYNADVRRFIEERLITKSGHRASVAKDDALAENISEDDIRNLERDRLIRVEERSGIEQIELTHDLLTGVIRESRDKRREQEAIQRVRKQRRRWAAIAVGMLIVSAVMLYQFLQTKKQEEQLRALNAVNNTQTQFINQTTDAIAELKLTAADPNIEVIRRLRGLRNALVANSSRVIEKGLEQTDEGAFVSAVVNALTSDNPRLVNDAVNRIVSRNDPEIVEAALEAVIDKMPASVPAETMSFAQLTALIAARSALVERIDELKAKYADKEPDLVGKAEEIRAIAVENVEVARAGEAEAFLRDISSNDARDVTEALDAAAANRDSITFLQTWDPALSPRLLMAARDAERRFSTVTTAPAAAVYTTPEVASDERSELIRLVRELRLDASVKALQSSALSRDARRELRDQLGEDYQDSPDLVDELLKAADDKDARWHAFDVLARKTQRSAWNKGLVDRARTYFGKTEEDGYGEDTRIQVMLLRVHLNTLGLIDKDPKLVDDVIATFEFSDKPSDYQAAPLLEFLESRTLSDAQARRLRAARG